jgi:hypothetical protein
MRRVRAPILLIPSVAAVLLVVGGFAVWRDEAPPAVPQTSFIDPDEPQPRSLTAEEESYEAAMWPLHREIIEASAGTMTLAGIIYVTEGRDVSKLVATVAPLERRFHDAHLKARAIAPPPSLAPVHAQYLEAMSLYEHASTEMLKLARDGREDHLVEAHRMAQQAAQDVVKAGDILWPGEHKPN